MASQKKTAVRRSVRAKGPLTAFPDDARELDEFVSSLDLSGNLTLLLSKPKKKSAKKK